MHNKILLFFLCQIFIIKSFSQTTFPSNGAPFKSHTIFAFINANIYADFETLIKNGVLIIKDDKVIAIGEKQEIPKNAIIFDLKGKYIYPSFIDIFCDYGLIIPKSEKKISFGPQIESNTKGAYGWNQAIKSNLEAYKLFSHNNEQAEELKKNGKHAI
jgi:hypothetical protein